MIYIVEVKHWLTQRPGSKELKKLIRVTAQRGGAGGLMLSTSGFSGKIYQGIAEADLRSVRLGGGEKVRALCRTYYRLGTELWMARDNLTKELFDGTVEAPTNFSD